VLVHQKHRGFFVAKRSHHELTQYHCMLELIEDEVIGSITWPTVDTVAHLRSLNDRMLLVADDYDPAETLALNREFHFQIFSLSPNSIMVDELSQCVFDLHGFPSPRASAVWHRLPTHRIPEGCLPPCG
jgi:DNA-binding GntR family transcriptional regulator